MTERLPTIQERKNLVIFNTETERKKNFDSRPPLEEFSRSNFPTLYLSPPRPSNRPYGEGFPYYLASHLREWAHKEVESHLHTLFPECDNVDCDYLEDVVQKLRLRGIWATDKPLVVAYPGSGKLFKANAVKVEKWVRKQRQLLLKAEETQNKLLVATRPFSGPVSDLAVALYILERNGVISLKAYRENKNNMAALCRDLCHMFPPQNTSSKNPALALKLALLKIPIDKLGVGEYDDSVLISLGKKNSYPAIKESHSSIALSLPIELIPKALIPS